MVMSSLQMAAQTLVEAYFLALVALAVYQRALLYHPDTATIPPVEAGLSQIETLHLTSADGQSLVAWFAPPAAGRPLILYFHGNGGVLAHRAERFRQFVGSGYGVLAVSYRGFGGSTGKPTQKGILLDAEAAYAEARKRGFSGRRVVFMGESLGAGVATIMASRHQAAALVLDAPYLSALNVARGRYPLFPVSVLMRDRFRADLAIRNVRMPVLMTHGDKDEVIPLSSGQRLFELAHEPKEFIVVRGGGHLVLSFASVYPRVKTFIDAATAAKDNWASRHERAPAD
jgi:fermentation-respiration switch protein FrsA (DUF1100 family)